jgi:hypothetical protein
MYNTVWCGGLNNNAGVAIFILLWSGYHGDMKIITIQNSHCG